MKTADTLSKSIMFDVIDTFDVLLNFTVTYIGKLGFKVIDDIYN
jgi:hypothetical protein